MTAQDQRTAGFFDRYAGEFNAIYGNRNTAVNRVVNSMLRRSMRLRYEMTIERCEPIAGASVLDIGCGPGHYSIELAKRGATRVLGIDFADGMLEIARTAAERAGVNKVCHFEHIDFFKHDFKEKFDFLLAMGFMDYVAEPEAMVRRALSLTTKRALFSFPLDGGFLAWQRKLRYRNRCDLFLYTREQVESLFRKAGVRNLDIVTIHRDLFVDAAV